MDTADLENRLSPRMSYMTLKKPMENQQFLYGMVFTHTKLFMSGASYDQVSHIVFSMLKKLFWLELP